MFGGFLASNANGSHVGEDDPHTAIERSVIRSE